MIRTTGLTKTFGDKLALDSVSIAFDSGAIHGVVGANGAGKTTMFRCLAGLYQYRGSVDFTDSSDIRNIGFMPANPEMLSRITGREYLQLMCSARGISPPDLDEKNVFDLPLNAYAESYSTGMTKKLALTGVLLQKNSVFLLDEPFSGVDIQSNIVIKEVIRKLKDLNKTVVMSSHIFSSLYDVCDTLHLLSDGQLVRSELPAGFAEIEKMMAGGEIGDKIDRLELE